MAKKTTHVRVDPKRPKRKRRRGKGKSIKKSSKTWQSYEEVAQYLLNEFAEHFKLGKVEGKQIVPGESGTEWEIDAKGIKCDGEGFIIVECRRHTRSRLNQESMAGLAFRIQDTGAQGGYCCKSPRSSKWS